MIPHRIVAFGSSSVYGRGDPEFGSFAGRLRQWHEPQHPGNLVYNLGVGGDTTSSMVMRFQGEVSYRYPNLILLYPGLNDIRRNGGRNVSTAVTPEVFQKNISFLIDEALKLAPTVFISPFPIDESRAAPWNSTSFCYFEDDAMRFVEAGIEICRTRDVLYLPIFETWSNFSNTNSLS